MNSWYIKMRPNPKIVEDNIKNPEGANRDVRFFDITYTTPFRAELSISII